MEEILVVLIPAVLAALLLRLLVLPMKLIVKLGLHAACGLVCLWILNTVAPFTGVLFPINGVTVLVAGILGLPGIGLMALLAVMV